MFFLRGSAPPPPPPPAVAPFHVVVLSGGRNSTSVVDQLVALDPDGALAEITLFDVDEESKRRPQKWFDALPKRVRVARPLNKVTPSEKNGARDKHGDPPERVRWRSKVAHDTYEAIAYGKSVREAHFVMLEDDVRLSRDFFPTLLRITRSRQRGGKEWLACTLLNPVEYDHGRVYRDLDEYVYEACAQGMLYNKGLSLEKLLDYFEKNWRHDPADWIIRDFQRLSKATICVAVPNVVQHVGAVSTFSGKVRHKKLTECVSHTFRE